MTFDDPYGDELVMPPNAPGAWLEGDPTPPTLPSLPSITPGNLGNLAFRRASEITPTVVRWFWDSRIAYAKLNTLGGAPGLGKSYITAALATAASRGSELPGDDRADQKPSRTLLLSFEDDPEDTVVPRLMMLGADLDLVDIIEGVDSDAAGRRALGPEDVALLAGHIVASEDVGLVVIDPVSAFVGGGTDEHRGNEVRAALEGLRLLAQEHGFAVVLVMHTRKSTADTALNRLSGSQAYGALVRSALMVGPIPEDDQERVALAHVKHNLASKQPTLAYSVDDTGLHWHGEIDFDAEQVAGNSDGTERSAADEAAAFLRDLLADGPVPSKQVLAEADEAGIAERTLKRAKDRLGIASRKVGGRWTWSPPDEARVPRVPSMNPGTVGPLDACKGCDAPADRTSAAGSPWCTRCWEDAAGGAA